MNCLSGLLTTLLTNLLSGLGTCGQQAAKIAEQIKSETPEAVSPTPNDNPEATSL